jgi:hypothetical protein
LPILADIQNRLNAAETQYQSAKIGVTNKPPTLAVGLRLIEEWRDTHLRRAADVLSQDGMLEGAGNYLSIGKTPQETWDILNADPSKLALLYYSNAPMDRTISG